MRRPRVDRAFRLHVFLPVIFSPKRRRHPRRRFAFLDLSVSPPLLPYLVIGRFPGIAS
ncbi:hypothetical protein OH687_05170 [Burkholderia anthina]|nr:hypothetical protein OH687_05170 [Burkholderia anthina]